MASRPAFGVSRTAIAMPPAATVQGRIESYNTFG